MPSTDAALRRAFAYAMVGTLLLATIAYWAPWVDHDAAALKLSGQDLGEFVKFLPEIRRGAARFPRQVFYLPAFATLCALVVLASARQAPYPRWLRLVLLLWAVLLLPALLPPAWGRIRELFAPEFRLQGLALVAGGLLIAAHGIVARIPRALVAPMLLLLAAVALLPAQVAFWAIRPRIWAAYATPTIRLGWGLWLHLAAWLGFACSVWVARPRPRRAVRVPSSGTP